MKNMIITTHAYVPASINWESIADEQNLLTHAHFSFLFLFAENPLSSYPINFDSLSSTSNDFLRH